MVTLSHPQYIEEVQSPYTKVQIPGLATVDSSLVLYYKRSICEKKIFGNVQNYKTMIKYENIKLCGMSSFLSVDMLF